MIKRAWPIALCAVALGAVAPVAGAFELPKLPIKLDLPQIPGQKKGEPPALPIPGPLPIPPKAPAPGDPQPGSKTLAEFDPEPTPTPSARLLDPWTEQAWTAWLEKITDLEKAGLKGATDKQLKDAEIYWLDDLDKHKKVQDYPQAVARLYPFYKHYFQKRLQADLAKAKQLRAKLDEDFGRLETERYIGSAVPAIGVNSRTVWDALDKNSPQYKDLQGLYQAAFKQVQGLQKATRHAKMAATKTPPDAYRGGDKAKLKAMVVARWKADYPNDQIIGVRLVSPGWGTRQKRRDWNSSGNWQVSDYQSIIVKLLVKDNAEEAWVYNLSLIKDYTAGGKIKVSTPFKKPESDEKMLVKNIKL